MVARRIALILAVAVIAPVSLWAAITVKMATQAPVNSSWHKTLLDMGGSSKPSAEEAEPVEEDVAELPEGEGKPKKGFFGKLFGGKKKR